MPTSLCPDSLIFIWISAMHNICIFVCMLNRILNNQSCIQTPKRPWHMPILAHTGIWFPNHSSSWYITDSSWSSLGSQEECCGNTLWLPSEALLCALTPNELGKQRFTLQAFPMLIMIPFQLGHICMLGRTGKVKLPLILLLTFSNIMTHYWQDKILPQSNLCSGWLWK